MLAGQQEGELAAITGRHSGKTEKPRFRAPAAPERGPRSPLQEWKSRSAIRLSRKAYREKRPADVNRNSLGGNAGWGIEEKP